MEVYIDPIAPAPSLYVIGAGHVGWHLGRIAADAGFRLHVVDDREKFANAERFPDAETIEVDDLAAWLHRVELPPTAYVVVVTRGHTHDFEAVRALAARDLRYLGPDRQPRQGGAHLRRARGRGHAARVPRPRARADRPRHRRHHPRRNRHQHPRGTDRDPPRQGRVGGVDEVVAATGHALVTKIRMIPRSPSLRGLRDIVTFESTVTSDHSY